MDPLGLLQTVVALLVYPGLASACVLGLVIQRFSRRRRGNEQTTTVVQISQLLAIGCAGIATGLLPVPWSPLGLVPPTTGPQPSAIGGLLFLSAAAAFTGAKWNWARLVAFGAAILPVIVVASVVGTTSLSAVFGLNETSLVVARIEAAVACVVAIPLLVATFDMSRLCDAVVAVAWAVFAATLSLTAVISSSGLAFVAEMAAVLACSLIVGVFHRVISNHRNFAAIAAAVLAVGSIVSALLVSPTP